MKQASLPFISVVTISYNQCQYLEETIQSVLNQHYPKLEYIIIDGGSNDNSVEIIKRHEKNLAYWVSGNDEGPAHALNKGLSRCSGDFFFYLNSDDCIQPNSFNDFAKFYLKKPSYDVYYGHGYFIDEKSVLRRKIYSTRWNPRAYVSGLAMLLQQATFFRLESVRKAGGFNQKNSTCWDGELLMDLDNIGAKFIRMPHQIGLFRIHANSITGSQRLQNKYFTDRQKIKNKYSHIQHFDIFQKYIFCISDPSVYINRLFQKFKNIGIC